MTSARYPPGMVRTTPWSRSRQVAVIVLFGVQAVYAASLPFWFIDTMTRYANDMNARFGTGTPPPDAAASLSQTNTIATEMFGVFVVLAVAVAVIAITGALLRWRWAYYAIMALLCLEALEGLSSVAGALLPSLLTGAPPPLPVLLPAVIIVVGAGSLFAWMVAGLARPAASTAPASIQ